jgi:tetratricopeptide (TPR) repeat protein
MHVFLSYQRKTGGWIAHLIKEKLEQRGCDVFLDVEQINSGRFDTVILNEIGKRDHFIVLLTPSVCENLGAKDDWVTRELDRAMELGKNVVPLLADGGLLTSVSSQFSRRTALLGLNALPLSHYHIDAEIAVLHDRFLANPTIQELEILTAEEHFLRGQTAQQEEDWAKAEREYALAVRLRRRPEYLLGLSVAKFRQGRADESLVDLDAAMSGDPFAPEIRDAKFELLQQVDRMREALELMRDWGLQAERRSNEITDRVLEKIATGSDLSACLDQIQELHFLYGRGPVFWRTGASVDTLLQHASGPRKAKLKSEWNSWRAKNADLDNGERSWNSQ